MMTFAFNQDNDIYLGDDGRLALIEDQSALIQICIHYARTLRGEMLHKADKGIPYWQTLFTHHADLPMFEAAFRQRIEEIAEVNFVESFSATIDNNTLNYHAVINTIYGSITLNA